MNKPKMIIFDYGQTLVNEKIFDPLKGTAAVLREATKNPNNISAEEVQALANQLSKEIGRYVVEPEKQTFLEVHIHIFQNYLYEYFGVEFTKSASEIERIFQRAACVGEPTENIEEFLKFLDNKHIRTSVISNISYSGELLKEIINNSIPSNKFEFIIASSEYVFRKPHKRIFELALRKAKLNPEEVWYCGDNALFDIDGAANCGIFPVWYKGAIEKSNKRVPSSECLTIYNWKEVMERLTLGEKMNSLVFGMPTLVEFDNLEANVTLCKDLGLDFIELNMNLPQFQVEKIDVNKLVQLKKNYDIFFTFHLPEELDVANFNDKIKKAYLDIVKETIEISKLLNCPIINMHMNLGTYFTLPNSKIYLYEKYFNEFYKSILEFGLEIEEFIGNSNVKISIENTGITILIYIKSSVRIIKKGKFQVNMGYRTRLFKW